MLTGSLNHHRTISSAQPTRLACYHSSSTHLQRARQADRILSRKPYLVHAASGGLRAMHHILRRLSLCTHDILALNSADRRSLPDGRLVWPRHGRLHVLSCMCSRGMSLFALI